MKHFKWWTTMALGIALVAAQPATAGPLTGSKKGLRVQVDVGARGNAHLATFAYEARCNGPRLTIEDTTVVALRGQARFRRTSNYTLPTDNGEEVRVRVRSAGRRLSRYRWRGTFSSSIVVRRDGRVVDRCRLTARRWSASTPQVRLAMSSDRGEYILQGRSYRYATPRNQISVEGNRFRIGIEAGPWSVDIAAPEGRWLRPGRYTGARRFPFNDERPGISVVGSGRGCNEVTGAFTVKSASYGPRGGLRAIKLSFVHHCEGGDKALRGTFTYRR